MYIPSTFKCNGCGRERTPSNGWYELHISEDETVLEASLYVCAFKSSEAAEHYCGKECLIRAISTRLRLLYPAVRSRGEAPVESREEVARELCLCTQNKWTGAVIRLEPRCPLHGNKQSEAPVEPEAPVVPEPVPTAVCTCSFAGGVTTPDPWCEVHGHE